MKLPIKAALILCAAGISTAQAAEVATTPVGVVTVNVAAGNGVNKVRSLISVPLLGDDDIAGRIVTSVSGVSANSLLSANAGWAPGALSIPSTPFLIRFTTGAAEGRTILLSTQTPNTSDTIYIDQGEASVTDLTSLGIAVGDFFQLLPCDTLASLFGTPESTGVMGGTSAAASDTLVVENSAGFSQTFYFNSTLNRWTRQALGNPDASNLPIRPDSGIMYLRLAASPLVLRITGSVPTTDRQALVKNSGMTLLSHSWPVGRNLADLGFETLPGWISSTAASNADTIIVGSSTYFFDGSNWRRQALGSPISNPIVDAGSTTIITKRGTAPGVSTLAQPIFYTLNQSPIPES